MKLTALYARLTRIHAWVVRSGERLAPVADLMLRLWVANVFWRAGLVKAASMYTTIYLFQHVYHVPFLPPVFAAYLSTGIELGFPVLLALGIATRYMAGFLFVYNAITVISYPALWPTGFTDHKIWALMLLVTLFHGPGILSIDALALRLRRGFRRASEPAT